MSEWKLHIPDRENRVTHYKCGFIAGQFVRLKQEIIVRDCDGNPTGKVHAAGEIWQVIEGVASDPVIWFREPDGSRSTWDDDANSVKDWFDEATEAEQRAAG